MNPDFCLYNTALSYQLPDLANHSLSKLIQIQLSKVNIKKIYTMKMNILNNLGRESDVRSSPGRESPDPSSLRSFMQRSRSKL